MKHLLVVTLLVAVAPVLVFAQQPPAATQPAAIAIAAIRTQWQGAISNITKAAEELSEADYAYRPVGTVRTFGELIGHVAGSQNLMCAAALGDKQPAEDAVEKAATSKAALVAALKASTAYCEKAYTISAASAGAPVEMFGDKSTKVGALVLNAVHDGEHYGNIVTYMRMKGMVPPSSKR